MNLIRWIVSKVFIIFPIKNTIIFESNPDFSDNAYWIYKYLVEKYKVYHKYKLVWFVSSNYNKKELCGAPITCVNIHGKSIKSIFCRLYYNFTAKIIFNVNSIIPKYRENQIRIFLGHGMLIKRCENYFDSVGKCDLFLVTGEGCSYMFEDYAKKETIKPFGYPRNEILYSNYINHTDENYIMWMPTYRQHKAVNAKIKNIFPLGIPLIKSIDEMVDLNQYLREIHYKLYLRVHPAQDLTVFKVQNMSNIVIADDIFLNSQGVTLYEFIAGCSALITDYSSVYYDFLLTGRPIGLTLEDAFIYSEEFGLIFDNIYDELPGRKMDNEIDLKEFISEVRNGIDDFAEEREKFRIKLGIEKLPACQLICDYLEDEYAINL